MRPAIALAVLLVGLMGCGGDDSDSDRPSARADSPARTDTSARTETGTARSPAPDAGPKPGPDSADEPSDGGARPKGDNTPDPADGPVASAPRRRTKESDAALRCIRRAARKTGNERLEAQARCVKLTAGRLSRLVRAACRRGAKSEAAYRNCIKAATGQ